MKIGNFLKLLNRARKIMALIRSLILLSNNKLVFQGISENFMLDIFAILILSRSFSICILKQSAF